MADFLLRLLHKKLNGYIELHSSEYNSCKLKSKFTIRDGLADKRMQAIA